ncbi:MAG: nucleoside-diphosphate kinase [Candidatus Dormibacteraeota bacterium]|uniref:Nucleoside diphosphate kinase n=1 Tax=Candidatus Aeolococcus gillhamiae TaxID=3127015 RepID=A0A2W5Z3E3_9BACT|nr:nucleoside-diphosphate kinase [Candidatus Dormibacteraeota bacterium]PZR79889.1 MAG: nucleoside-diphosphate kinase [Candidatus Dormibacter sp. RRmetagenome_bin12]
MQSERTLVLIKPDAVQRGLVGEIVGRLERRGLHPVGIKLMKVTTAMAERHYGEHRDKPFFGGLVEFITSSPVVAMVWEGPGAVALVRTMMGTTNPQSSPPGTIRGDLAVSLAMNVIHGSDSPQSAAREVAIFFSEKELLDWESSGAGWILSDD